MKETATPYFTEIGHLYGGTEYSVRSRPYSTSVLYGVPYQRLFAAEAMRYDLSCAQRLQFPPLHCPLLCRLPWTHQRHEDRSGVAGPEETSEQRKREMALSHNPLGWRHRTIAIG